MSRGLYLVVILVLVSGSFLPVQSRSVDQVDQQQQNNLDEEQQVDLLDKRISSSDRIDASDLFEGLQLAGYG